MNQKITDLLDLALSFVGTIEDNNDNDSEMIRLFQSYYGQPHKEPYCVAFAEYCVRQIDIKYNSETVLFATESSQILWAKTPKIARIEKPEPGCIAVWTVWNNGLPTSHGHVGIVYEVVNDEWMTVIEANVHDPDKKENDGIYIKKRKTKMLDGDFRTTGFLLPWV